MGKKGKNTAKKKAARQEAKKREKSQRVPTAAATAEEDEDRSGERWASEQAARLTDAMFGGGGIGSGVPLSDIEQAAAAEYEAMGGDDSTDDEDAAYRHAPDDALAAAFMQCFPNSDAGKDPDAYQPKASTVLLLQSVVDSGRMTLDEYEAAEISLRIEIEGEKTIPEKERELVAKWSQYALSLPHWVILRNLKSRKDLNGKRGRAVSWVKETSRYEVRLGPGNTGTTIAVRPENVQPVSDRKGLEGRCWNDAGWNSVLLKCDGRLPVDGEVSLIIEGPYPKSDADQDEDEGYKRTFDRKAVACVFTYKGKMHLLESPKLGGTAMLSESKVYDIDDKPSVNNAFVVGEEQDRMLILADKDDEAGIGYSLFLYEYPEMDLIKRYSGDDGKEFARAEMRSGMISVGDCYEDTLALVFRSREERRLFSPINDSKMCVYGYKSSPKEDGDYLEKVSEWDLPEEVAQGNGRICDICVIAGGVGAQVATLSYNGLVRIWNTDSPAGCVAILNGSLESPAVKGKVGGLSTSNWGTICRLPRAMKKHERQEADIVTCHNQTLSAWNTSMYKDKVPERVDAIYNPKTSRKSMNITCDAEFEFGIFISVGDIKIVFEDGENMDATQLAMWCPARDACLTALELPYEFEIPKGSVRFCGGRLLMASGLGDVRKSSSSGCHRYGRNTCYVYVVSSREDDAFEQRSKTTPRPRMGVEPSSPPGILADLLYDNNVRVDDQPPKGLNMSIAFSNIPNLPGETLVSPADVRPCALMCHGCGRLSKLSSLSVCTGCTRAFYCSKSCQKESWPMHKRTCKAHQHLRDWLRNRGVLNE